MIYICALLLLATVILLKALLLLEFAQHQLRERKQGARRENDFNLLSKKYDKLHHSYDTGRYRTDLPIMRIMHIYIICHTWVDVVAVVGAVDRLLLERFG